STANYFTAYQWYKGNALIPGATSWSTAIRDTGSYKVRVTDTNGCQSVSPALPVVSLGVGNVLTAADINIYPNPATDVLTIDAPVALNAQITTADGRVALSALTGNHINIASLAPGLYIITLTDTDGNRVHTARFVKQ
ncbi:MAG: T9SS C-terminal target domain-containing protein, partial [Chitinophagia bacterium]|nr:T9SS C-terminal target domain-containing protein [Chitinophagia bacterium]